MILYAFSFFFFFFFNDTATTEIYTLSLHDALPIYGAVLYGPEMAERVERRGAFAASEQLRDALARIRGSGRRGALVENTFERQDRKSTRLNSSHANISYAVFCLKKKKKKKNNLHIK